MITVYISQFRWSLVMFIVLQLYWHRIVDNFKKIKDIISKMYCLKIPNIKQPGRNNPILDSIIKRKNFFIFEKEKMRCTM